MADVVGGVLVLRLSAAFARLVAWPVFATDAFVVVKRAKFGNLVRTALAAFARVVVVFRAAVGNLAPE